MAYYKLPVLSLPPARFTYFRLIELLGLYVFAALWKQGDLTWTTGVSAFFWLFCFYAITPLVLELQRPRHQAAYERLALRVAELLAREADPVRREWLEKYAERLPKHFHAVLDPEPIYQRFRLLAKLMIEAYRMIVSSHKN